MQNAFLEKHLPSIQEKGQEESYDYLQREVPELKALHDTELIENITLTKLRVIGILSAIVELEVLAPKLFPHAKATLIRAGLIKDHNVSNIIQKDTDMQKMRLGFYASTLQVVLRIRRQAE